MLRTAFFLPAFFISTDAALAQALPGGFVYLRDIDPTIIQDIRHAGANDFIGRPLKGYDAAECIVRRAVRLRLKAARDHAGSASLA